MKKLMAIAILITIILTAGDNADPRPPDGPTSPISPISHTYLPVIYK